MDLVLEEAALALLDLLVETLNSVVLQLYLHLRGVSDPARDRQGQNEPAERPSTVQRAPHLHPAVTKYHTQSVRVSSDESALKPRLFKTLAGTLPAH